MKKTVWITFIIAASMLLMPLSAVGNAPQETEILQTGTNQTLKEESPTVSDTFRLYDPETEKITEISREDYIFGVVAAEMPALYDIEALKAQSVAAYTYACYNRNLRKDEKYDLSTDPNDSQCFITKAQAQEKWGSKAEEYKEKIETAVRETENYVIKYNNEIILAVYHAISNGKTEDCSNVWGKGYNYLKSVDSSWDKESPDYKKTVEFTTEELKEKIGSNIKWGKKPQNFFGKCTYYKSGNVKEIALCSTKISGVEIRKKLDLRSSCFKVEYKNGKFLFTTYGYGHGVGMSQYGANALASQGKDFKEILSHYYTDCTVEKLK